MISPTGGGNKEKSRQRKWHVQRYRSMSGHEVLGKWLEVWVSRLAEDKIRMVSKILFVALDFFQLEVGEAGERNKSF